MKDKRSTKENKLFRRSIIVELIQSVFIFALTLVLLQIIAELINQAVFADTRKTVLLSGVTIIILICSLPFIYGMNKWAEKIRYTTIQRYRDSLYPHIITGALLVSSEGDLSVKLNRDVDTITSYMFTILPGSISAVIILLIVSVMSFLMNPLISILFVGISLLQIIPTLFYEKWARKVYNEVHMDEEAYKSWMVEGFRGMQTLKVYRREGWFIKHFSSLNRKVFLSGIRAEKIGTWETVIQEIIGAFITYGNYLVVGSFAFMGKIELQNIPLLILLGEYVFSSVSSLYEMRVAHFEYREAFERLIFTEKEPTHTNAPDALIEARHIRKNFGDKIVLNDVSLQVSQFSRFLFVGDNGSGKSTLFNILSSYSSADDGTVSQKKDLRLPYVAQEDAELPFGVMEVADALIKQTTMQREAFLMNIAGFGLEKDILDQPIANLSEGERKKVFLSFALAEDTDLMILDEPTNHLDLDGADYLLRFLRQYRGALLVSSHDDRIQELEWDHVYSLCGCRINA